MDLTLHAIIAGLLLRIGLSDWRQRRIANHDVVVVALATGLGAVLTQPPAAEVAASYAVALALTLPGFLLGRVGGGDVKLLCALAPLWPVVELLAVFVGGMVAVCMVLLATMPYRRSLAGGPGDENSPPAGLPLGTAMMCGTFFWLAAELFAHV